MRISIIDPNQLLDNRAANQMNIQIREIRDIKEIPRIPLTKKEISLNPQIREEKIFDYYMPIGM